MPDPEFGEGQAAVARGANSPIAGDGAQWIARHRRVPEGPLDSEIHGVQEPGAGQLPGHGSVEGEAVQIRAGSVEIQFRQPKVHVAHAEPAPPVGDRHQIAIDLSAGAGEVQVANVVGGPGAGFRSGSEYPSARHRGEIGGNPAQVLQVDMGSDDLEVKQDGVAGPGDRAAAGEPGVGQRSPGETEDRAVTPDPDPAYRVAQRHPGVVDPGGERVEVDGKRLTVGRGDAQPGHPGGKIGQSDDPPQSLPGLLHDPAWLGPLGLERRIDAALGAGRLGRIPRQRDPEHALRHPDVVELDQGGFPALGALTDAQHLFVVHPAVAVLDQLDGGAIQLNRHSAPPGRR